jgi:hypothetical protein
LSKRTKRVGLAVLLLSLTLGGATLYLHANRSPGGAEQAAAGKTSISIAAAPAPTPVAATPLADPPVVDRARAPAPTIVIAAAVKARSDGARRRARPERSEPGDKEPLRSEKTVAVAIVEPERPAQQAAAPTAETAAVPQERWGNLTIQIRPKLGDTVHSFEIAKVAAFVDGRQVSALDGKDFGQHNPEVQAWNSTITAGEHVLNVVVEYHGNGHSVFSYFDGYRYTARSSTLFRIEDRARLEMTVDLLDRGGVNTPFERRLAIAFAKR